MVRNGIISKNAFRNTSAIPTTPSAPLRWLRIFFFMAQPPLLTQEGNCPPQIDSQLLINERAVIDRAYSYKTRLRIHRKAFGMKGFQVLFMLLVTRES